MPVSNLEQRNGMPFSLVVINQENSNKEATLLIGTEYLDHRVMGSIPGKFPGEENGNPVQYSWLEKSMDRGAWRATVHEPRRYLPD